MNEKQRRANERAEHSWMVKFCWLLGLATTAAVVLVLAGRYYWGPPQKPLDSFFSLSVRAQAQDGRNILCDLKMLIRPEQEAGLAARQAKLTAAAASALADNFDVRTRRPDLKALPDDLLEAINQAVPKKLRIREVYIQNLVYGV